MALINCPHCGKEISEKAISCPGCGGEIPKADVEGKTDTAVCEECGMEYPEGTEACPNCGCPRPEATKTEEPQKVAVTGISLSNVAKKKILVIGAACVAVALLVVLLIAGINRHKAAQHESDIDSYNWGIESTSTFLLDGAAKAETAGNLIKSVWYNAINEEYDTETDKYTRPDGYFVDDFNEALANLFADEDFRADQKEIKDHQSAAAERMKLLTNPPEECRDAYEAINNYYDAYLTLTNLAANPKGSLQTFSSNFNQADTETANAWEKMQRYFD